MASATIVWFRRDLRLEDNPALSAAARAGPIIPLFIWSPEEEGQFQPGRVSRWWLKQSLVQLDMSLRSLGVELVMRRTTDALSVLLEIVQNSEASQVFYNHLYDPISLVRDHRVKQGLTQRGIKVQSFNGELLYEPWEVLDDEGNPFTSFESYWRKCLNMPFDPDAPLLPPRRIVPASGKVSGCSAEELGLEDESEKDSNALLARAWAPGWSNADRALEAFLAGPLLNYSTNRQKIDGPTTSLLSPHMHFGEVSVRKVFHLVCRKQILWAKEGLILGEESINYFLRSIGFREYARYLCFNFPFTHERSLLSNLRSFPWRVDEGYFKVWRQGRTGYPLVDAGMRELWATGWLHNRARVIVSSFCVKFLLLPWRWGMKYFWDTLLDADLESDILGWQYISGSLPDGHELDRMDNPQTEGYKHDPDGEYVRRWLPELARLPSEWIHHPWDAPPSVLRAAGVELGCNYPRPIVEVIAARERLQQAVVHMWQQEAALRAATAEEGASKATEAMGVTWPMISYRPARAATGGPTGDVSLKSSHHDQQVPSSANQLYLKETSGLKDVFHAKLFNHQSQSKQPPSTMPIISGQVPHTTQKCNSKVMENHQALMDTLGAAAAAPSDNNSTAESSLPRGQGNGIPANQQVSEFGCIPYPSDTGCHSRSLLQNLESNKVEESRLSSTRLKRKA